MSLPLSPHELLPRKESSALLVVDVQERLMAAMESQTAARVVRNITILVETAKDFQLPILWTEQYTRGLGPTVAEIKAALPQDLQPLEKLTFSCCTAPGFQPLLDAVGDRDIILCGVETHVCMLQTTLDLLAAGRKVYVAADATCSRARENSKVGLKLMRQAGAVIGSTETFAFALLGEAGSEQFKRISRLVK